MRIWVVGGGMPKGKQTGTITEFVRMVNQFTIDKGYIEGFGQKINNFGWGGLMKSQERLSGLYIYVCMYVYAGVVDKISPCRIFLDRMWCLDIGSILWHIHFHFVDLASCN